MQQSIASGGRDGSCRVCRTMPITAKMSSCLRHIDQQEEVGEGNLCLVSAGVKSFDAFKKENVEFYFVSFIVDSSYPNF